MKKNKTNRISDAAYKVAEKATFNNPVSVLKLGLVADFAQRLLDSGITPEGAIAKTAEFIKQI